MLLCSNNNPGFPFPLRLMLITFDIPVVDIIDILRIFFYNCEKLEHE